VSVFYKAAFLPTLLVGLTFLAAHPAQAQNLVQDGNFEAADPGAADGSQDYSFTASNPFDTSWTIVQGTAGIDTTTPYVYGGAKSLYLNVDSGGATTTISQDLATTPGTSYTLSFWADDDGNNPLNVTFGGTTLGPIDIPQNGYPNPDPGSNASSFTFFSYQVSVTDPLTSLTFSASNNGNGSATEIDDISVQAVPETSTLISLGLMLGLGGIAFAACKRQRLSA